MPPTHLTFAAEDGPDQIAECFTDVRVHRYEDELTIREPGLVVDYFGTLAELTVGERAALLGAAQRAIDADGALVVDKHVVLITARAPH